MSRDDVQRPIVDVLASQVEPRDPVLLLDQPPVPMHGITIIAGYRGVTKTTFTCWLAAEATRRGYVVAICSLEDPVNSFVVPRLIAHGAEMRLVRLIDPTKGLRLPKDELELAFYVQEHDVKLLIIDPLESAVPGLTSPDRVRDALTPITEMSMHCDCAVVFSHHFRKSGGKDYFEAVGGSGAITNAARACYAYGPVNDPLATLVRHLRGIETDSNDGEEERILAVAKLSASRDPPSLSFQVDEVSVPRLLNTVPRLNLIGESSVTADDLAASRSGGRVPQQHRTAVEEAIRWLLAKLLDGTQRSADLVDAAKRDGISPRTLERARHELVRQGTITTYQESGQHWVRMVDLPDTLPE